MGINKDSSVDFSDDGGDHEGKREKSLGYSSDEANEVDEDYYGSDLDDKVDKYYEAEPVLYRHHDDDEW